MQPLNIVYIHSHDTGRWISPYGYAACTPHLQRFAEDAVVFRQAFCAAPTCSPSRSALLTGTWPHRNGMWGLAHRGFRLHDPKMHLASVLHGAGYQSVLCGIQHEARHGEDLGYQRVLELAGPQHESEAVATAAANFLCGRHQQPFFLSIGFFQTHREFPTLSAANDGRYLRPPPTLPDTPEMRRDMAGFHESLQQLDSGVGRVLTALQQSGLAETTLVLITTDHGPPFPSMKCNLTDHGLGVLLMLRGPQECRGGRVVDALVSHLDVFPTICDFAGISPPAWLCGRSLRPLIRGEVGALHDAIYGEINFHCPYEPQRCVRTRRYKYIRRFDPPRGPLLANCDNSPGKELWLKEGWASRIQPEEELFDLVFDPQEANNVASRPEYAAVLADMRSCLAAWQRDTADPVLGGPLHVPPGARVNAPEAVDPEELLS